MAATVLAAIVLLPLVFVPSLDDGFALPKVVVLRVLGLVGAALVLGYVAVGGSLTRSADRRIDIPLAFFAGLLIASSIASVDPVQSFSGEPYQYQGLVTVLLYIGSFYVARLALGTERGFQAVLVAMVCTGAIVAAYGVAQGLGVDPFWSSPPDEGRVISSVGQANNLAAYLDLVVVAALGLWSAAGRRWRLALVVVVVLSVVALGLTFSRGGYLGLVVALAVLFVAGRRRWPRRREAAMALGAAAVVLAVVIALPATRSIVERVADRTAASVDAGESSIRFHLDLWRIGTRIAIDYPVLGTGPETFPLVFRPYLDELLPPDRAELLGRFRLESPHNELIGVAAEMGLPALLAYLAFLIACAIACVRVVRAADGPTRSIALVVLATLTVHVVTTFFMTPETTTSALFWITMGAGLAAMRPRAEDGETGPKAGFDR